MLMRTHDAHFFRMRTADAEMAGRESVFGGACRGRSMLVTYHGQRATHSYHAARRGAAAEPTRTLAIASENMWATFALMTRRISLAWREKQCYLSITPS